MPKKRIKVAVLCGGVSNEREISILSGKNIVTSLPKDRYDVSLVEITKNLKWILKDGKNKKTITLFDKNHGIAKSGLKRFDVAFIALHGAFGEDGKLQAILDLIGIPYTGSGVLASALGMDKIKTLGIAEKHGIKTPRLFLLTPESIYKANYDSLIESIGYPCVVKPNKSGSSVGITIVKNKKELPQAIKRGFKEDGKILIEEYINGRELTCGVMGNTGKTGVVALPPIEIIPSKPFFDYEAKYFSPDTQEICPAKVNKRITKEISRLSIKIHELLGCDGLTRSDFILSKNNNLYFLEINTIPGLTESSLCPKEAKAMGISFAEFLDKQIKLALVKR